MMTNKSEHALAELCPCSRGQVDALLDIICEVSRSVVRNLYESAHERIERVRTVQIVSHREFAHEGDVVGS